MVVIIHRSHELCYYKAIFSRFETILLFCTLFLESHLINTTSPHFQLPFIDVTTHYCYYHSIGILHIKWYATQLLFLLKKFFQLNHIVNLLQVIFKCIVKKPLWWLHTSKNSTYSMCSLPTCNHIIIANDIISPCTLLYL